MRGAGRLYAVHVAVAALGLGLLGAGSVLILARQSFAFPRPRLRRPVDLRPRSFPSSRLMASVSEQTKQIDLFDRALFAGPEWACSRAEGRVLEIAVGSGRNLPHHRGDVELSGIELSPEMLAIAQRRAEELGREIAHGATTESIRAARSARRSCASCSSHTAARPRRPTPG